ncbi:TULIP family P47-like protein [Planotetraspora sp. A-T 1434]|uniref:TULIP family P47-like protein n=1 Tax=Planotetraspora sp. A-T 1434 TaxID=2979219 RepID=UPI0021C01311|nr:TULIP family P47-like protein [Planotetraspora sp. A-T 1434]MCT9932153.1 TULIP family P47-like protein [Planotetraspora sp. A-T 1434]
MTLRVPLDFDKDQLLHLELRDARTAENRNVLDAARLDNEQIKSSVTFTTNGWDTVFAIRLTDVNRAIAARGKSPEKWQATIQASDFGPQIDGAGTFGAWSLATGAGSGTDVRMHLPFTASVTTNGKSHEVTGGVAYALVHLIYLPDSGETGPGDRELRLQTKGGNPDRPVVEVSSVTYTSPAQNSGLDNALMQLLQEWSNANLDQFDHVFATVNIGKTESEAGGAFAWLKPTYTAYAYADAKSTDDALLGVLCMTEGRSIAGTLDELAAGALPYGARAGLSISPERFMTKMALPAVIGHFPKADPKTFRVANNNTQIEATAEVALDPVRVGLIDYHPQMTTFEVSLNGNELITYSYVKTNISPGIDAYAEVTHYATLALGKKADGTQTLTFVETKEPRKKGWSEVAPWVQGVEIAADVILAVASLVASNVATASKRLIIRIVVAVVAAGIIGTIAAVLEKIPEWIAGDVPDALPSADALVGGATGSITWTNAKKEFTLTQIVLNGALQLGGDPGFPAS